MQKYELKKFEVKYTYKNKTLYATLKDVTIRCALNRIYDALDEKYGENETYVLGITEVK